MPELPDVTAYIEALEQRICGHTLTQAQIASPFLLRTIEPPVEACVGHKVSAIKRVDKRIAIGFDNDIWIVLHLMIAGRLHWSEKTKKADGRRTLAAFIFDNGCLTLTEAGSQKRASLHMARGKAGLAALDPGGIDVMAASLDEFARALTAGNHTLKRALTDPHVFSGIGNAYSDEILHRAQLSPITLTSKLTSDEIARLRIATREALQVDQAPSCRRRRRISGEGYGVPAPRWPVLVLASSPALAVARFSASATRRMRQHYGANRRTTARRSCIESPVGERLAAYAQKLRRPSPADLLSQNLAEADLLCDKQVLDELAIRNATNDLVRSFAYSPLSHGDVLRSAAQPMNILSLKFRIVNVVSLVLNIFFIIGVPAKGEFFRYPEGAVETPFVEAIHAQIDCILDIGTSRLEANNDVFVIKADDVPNLQHALGVLLSPQNRAGKSSDTPPLALGLLEDQNARFTSDANRELQDGFHLGIVVEIDAIKPRIPDESWVCGKLHLIFPSKIQESAPSILNRRADEVLE